MSHIANACKFLIFENTGVIVMRKVFFLPIIVTQLMSDTATANIFQALKIGLVCRLK